MARMSTTHQPEEVGLVEALRPGGASFHAAVADRALAGEDLTPAEALAVLRSADDDLLDLLAAAYRVRRRWFGNRVHLNLLVNAKSGRCGEDCGYCSQSKVSTAPIRRYDLLSPEEILDGAREAAARRAGTYCVVVSGRAPSARDLDLIARVVPEIKSRWPLKVCVSPGLLDDAQAARLRDCGVDRVNHNLNTSRRFYPAICTTHTYDERLETLRAVRRAGLEICSGGIVGMGEEDEDVVELALTLGELKVEALPVNFLLPIAGTPLESVRRLDPRYCLKVLALMRLANPAGELRIAAGREEHLGPLQPLGLYAASSIFVGDYLTTPGQPPEEDYRMIRALGFEPAAER
jgi:biotin synthase